MTIGEQIQRLRIEKGLTQERLAEMLEVSRQSISKWELGQAVPDVDKIIRMSRLFDVSTDTLLLTEAAAKEAIQNPLHLGSIYLVVKDFERSVAFYEKLLRVKADGRCRSGNQFVSFYFDNKCLSLMNEGNISGHRTDLNSPYKFVQNYWVEDLEAEYRRVKQLDIGEMTEITEAYPTYRYFHLYDPDRNVIEITGGSSEDASFCQSCGMPLTEEALHGTNADGSRSADYCRYCYQSGRFSRDETVEEMIESCIPFMTEGGAMTEAEARKKLSEELPRLKRWRKDTTH